MSEIDDNENEFRDIPNFEGLYQINKKGQVKSLERIDEAGRLLKERILKNTISSNLYYKLILSKNKKQKTVKIHYLLYNTFVGNYDKRYFEIDHIDKNRQNNKLENLRLLSRRNNQCNRTDQSIFGTGVCKNGNKYRTIIRINNKKIYLGVFDTPEQSHQKYLDVKSKIEEIEKITRNYDYKRIKIGYEYFIEILPIL